MSSFVAKSVHARARSSTFSCSIVVVFGFPLAYVRSSRLLIHVDTFRCAQLYDECKSSSPRGGRLTEVERLVKLGANGSGYRDPGEVRRIS